ncbi:vitellogenin-1-like [Episyrphus balteatus]|uniref:vitellogenin-1-like n=1 Tax=Episyrphus balteatus TaxID=286459 RepID=UPI002485C528|nr:vitellogenin-1-like [Episyrphus balteatus]
MFLIKIALPIFLLATIGSLSFALDNNIPMESNQPMPEMNQPENSENQSTWTQEADQSSPSVESVSFESLESMPVEQGSFLLKTVAQQSYMRQNTETLFTPNMEQVKMYLITPNGNVSIPQTNIGDFLSNYPQLITGEVTIFVTGIPSTPEDPTDAIYEIVEAYRARYQGNENQIQYSDSWDAPTTGSLIIIDLGNSLTNFLNWATLDIEEAGKMVGQAIVNMTEIVPYYNIHLIGHSVGAHVAGAAARYFAQEKNIQLRRVTGLDPSQIFTGEQHMESKLNRGVADFVDVIHTTSYGAGSDSNGDVDFYPSGPGSIPPGSTNIVDAMLKAIRYYAETVMPGGERSFMAVGCNSLKNYNKHRCHGIRVPMGYTTPYDVKGDFVMKVKSKSPYGKNAKTSMKNYRMRGTAIAF